ncbi:GNAT family N-acetyltransferase [Streptomyces luteolifulvus]|uniref:GNAT family N-acetyltransferase n=1 Tax=Streptomyces luteolifulvus TaxID=2615112 RepID=A0A6H9UWM7_9ACTN|nr:GNAT family N-acetyltransferase [Streptomyces luteolifulvus]KAB1144714.1 GNAT family N-acetyltransferase [Streptomyces luteolifulvus]
MTESSLRDRIETYYAAVPLLFAEAEDFGPLRLFVRREPGAPYYGGPHHASPTPSSSSPVTAEDIARVRARQRELGVPDAFEWLAEAAPSLRTIVEEAGLPVAERPLMVLDPDHRLPPQSLPEGVTIRTVAADDPALPAVLALPGLAFAAPGSAGESAGPTELALAAEKLAVDGTTEATRPSLRAGHKTLIAAFAPDGTPLAAGHYHPADATTEIGGICTLATARRQGLGAAVTTALAGHAREHGVRTIFLAYAEDAAARLYARLGFRPAGTTLLIANQPARGQ